MGQHCSTPCLSKHHELGTPTSLASTGLGSKCFDQVGMNNPGEVGKEALAWVNKLFQLLWADMDKVAKTIIEHHITPRIKQAASQKTSQIKDMRFSKFTLGTASPIIGGLHVEAMPFGGSKVCMSVKYVSDMHVELHSTIMSQDVSVGMKEFCLEGEAVILMRPMAEEFENPRGGMTLYFVNKPKIDLDFTGLAEIADMVGVREIVRHQITSMMAEKVVLPNAVTQLFGYEDLQMFPPVVGPPHAPIGALRVNLKEVAGVRSGDFEMFKKKVDLDNYVQLNLGDQEYKIYTAKLPQMVTLPVLDTRQRLNIDIWDEDKVSSNDKLGSVGELNVTELLAVSGKKLPVHDETVKDGGTLEMEVKFFNSRMHKLGSEWTLVVMQAQEVKLEGYSGGNICLRAKLGANERTTPAGQQVRSNVKDKTVASVMEDMKERLRKEKMKEADIERLTTLHGLRSTDKFCRVSLHYNLNFPVRTEELSNAELELSIIEKGKKESRELAHCKLALAPLLQKPKLTEPIIMKREEDRQTKVIEVRASTFVCALENSAAVGESDVLDPLSIPVGVAKEAGPVV